MSEPEKTLKNKWRGQTSGTKFKVPSISQTGSTSHGNDNEDAPVDSISKYFGIESGSYVPSCVFSKRNGHCYVLPYSHLPDVELEGDNLEKLIIRSTRRTIILHGQNFAELINWFANYQVKWIAESATAFKDAAEDLFIKEIEFVNPDEDELEL